MMNDAMRSNVGSTDRTLRIALGIFVLSLLFWGPRTPWAWLGLIPLLTGLAGVCPFYRLLRVSTNR